MTQKWFVSQGDRVFGPWSTDDVFTHRAQGNIADHDLIWGSKQGAWISIARWNPEAAFARPAASEPASARPTAAAAAPVATESVFIARPTPATRPAAETAAATKLVAQTVDFDEVTAITTITQASRDAAETVFSPVANEVWHFAHNGQSHGPYNRPNLLIELRRLDSPEGVVLWTKGMREWAGLFEFHEIANELGVSQRRFARAAITGRAVLEVDGLTQVAPLASISEGGLGLTLNSEFFAGQPVTVEIQSDALGAAFKLDAEVRYCARGHVGLKFAAPSSNVRSRIAGYVKHAGQTKAA